MMKKARFLKHPLTVICAIILGVLTGIYSREFSLQIAVFGKMYLSLLKMCVIPIFVTAIITSVAKLFRSENARENIRKILCVFFIFLFSTGILCVALELVVQPGKNIAPHAQTVLGQLLSNADRESGGGDSRFARTQSFTEFVQGMIPENIFSALSHGYSLQILFFAIILGCATGLSKGEHSELVIAVTESFFKIFFNIIGGIIYLLPLALFCLLASQIAGTGVDILLAMLKFILSIYLISILMMIINGFVIRIYSGNSFLGSFLKIKECLLIAFGTQSTFASIPACIGGLADGLKLNRELINLVIPIGAVICRFSMVILYVSATIFTAQLYGVALGFKALIICLVLSILAAVAGAGTPGIVSISMIAIVLTPLKLPAEAIIVLLLSVNPLIEPITTMTNVHANCAAATVVAAKN